MSSPAKDKVDTKIGCGSALGDMRPEEWRQYVQLMVEALPTPIQNRVVVLKNMQLENIKLEKEFFDEVYDLEHRYHKKYEELFAKRRDIVEGKMEPPGEQKPNFKDVKPLAGHAGVEFRRKLKDYKCELTDAKGIPDFWLTVFRNTLINEMIQPQDEPALRHLIDVSVAFDVGHAFTLEFHFGPNEFFTNSILRKKYFLRSSIDQNDPFAFKGPEVKFCQGCTIYWEDTMDLTVMTYNAKEKDKFGVKRTVVKKDWIDSFFNFFNPPDLSDYENNDEQSAEAERILQADYKIGHFLRVRVIPKAVLYFTGDIVDYVEGATPEEPPKDVDQPGDKVSVGNQCDSE
ncbi:nucleosome assembly protein 1-like 1-A [Drosophila rhopaloa]|uniref:Nucleosome assembly protein 1-like 1-A n=1 Tax=Drosophila rhopaloa TaxID=1041015 RepID=A0A6P4F5L7_DRORH|nr:nucleosome assembly protein 1-like 1-A [Drosophila rhopaloa]